MKIWYVFSATRRTGLIVPWPLGMAFSSQSLVKSMMPRSVVDHSTGGFQSPSGEYDADDLTILLMSFFKLSSATINTSASAATRYSAGVAVLIQLGTRIPPDAPPKPLARKGRPNKEILTSNGFYGNER